MTTPPDILFVQDSNLVYTSALNLPAHCPAQNVLGKTDFDLLPAQEAQRLSDLKRLAMQDGSVQKTELARLFSGEPRCYELTLFPLPAPGGLISYLRDVTDRKKVEQALRDSEANARALLNAPQEAMGLFDVAGNLLDANQALASRFGAAVDDLLGTGFLKHVPRELILQRLDCFSQATRSGRPLTFIDQRDGLWAETTIYPLAAPGGAFDRAVLVVRDITALKLAEEKLGFKARLLESASEAVIGVDLAHRVQSWNPAAEALYGWTAQEALGQDVSELMRPEFLASSPEQAGQSLRERGAWQGEMLSHCKDGSLRRLQISITTVKDGAGLRTGFVSISRDISEQRSLEDLLRYQAGLLESAQEAILSTDLSHRIVSWNPAARAIYGWTVQEALGREVGELLQVEHIGRSRQEVVAELEQRGAWRGRLFERTKDGRRIAIQCTASAIKDKHGRRCGYVVVAQEITAQLHAEQTLRYQSHLLDSIQEAVLSTNLQHRIISWNPAAETVFGWSSAEALGQEADALLRPEMLGSSVPETLAVIEQYGTWNGRLYLHRKDGRRFGAQATISAIEDKDGNRVGYATVAQDISAQLQAEATLRYQAGLLKSIQDAVISTDTRNCIVSWNPAAEKMYGWTVAEALGQDIGSLLQPEYIDTHSEQVREDLHRHGAWRGRLYHHDRQGRLIAVHATVSAIEAAAGQPAGHVVVVRDISGQVRLEELLRYQARLLESTQDAIISIDLQDRIASWNPAAERIFGWTAQEAIGQVISKLFQSEFIGACLQQVHEELQRSGTWSGRVFERCKDGRRIAIQSTSNTIEDASGQPAGRVIVLRDITRQLEVEDVLRYQASLLATTQDAVIVMDQNLTITAWSATAETIYGYSETEASGCVIGELLHSEFTPSARAAVLADLADIGSWHGRVFQTRKDGLRIPVSISVSLLRDDSGAAIGYVAFNRDISDLVQAEQRLQEYATQLEAKVEERTRELCIAQERMLRQERLAALGQLAGEVGHELRNPLSTIKNAVYLLRHIQPDAAEPVKEYLELIDREVRESSQIISDLLDYGRAQSGEPRALSAGELLAAALAKFPPPVGVQVHAAAALSSNPRLIADQRQVVQVLGNLILNACQAMPGGGELRLRTWQEGCRVAIAVSDTGSGIKDEDLPRLFEPLFTTKSRGIGLGLAVSKKFIEANGGSIEVTSQIGQGSTFTVWLPAAVSG
jgi:PAS domain S-box-containing protein